MKSLQYQKRVLSYSEKVKKGFVLFVLLFYSYKAIKACMIILLHND